jgi:hypothetical protein
VDNKKPTEKLEVEELEKRKAPFASPIVYRDGDGIGGGGTESYVPRRETSVEPTADPILPKPPRMDRVTE